MPLTPSTQEGKPGKSLELEASLVYGVSSRAARATERNPVKKKKYKEKKKMYLSNSSSKYLA